MTAWRAPKIVVRVDRRRRAYLFRDELTEVLRSGLFDPVWYANQYPDFLRSGLSPEKHYAQFGVWEERSPSLMFDTHAYIRTFGTRRGVPSIFDYLTEGDAAGKSPNMLFDTRWYRSTYGNRLRTHDHTILHYLRQPPEAGYWPNPLFDTAWFHETYGDAVSKSSSPHPFVHYAEVDVARILKPNPFFDPVWYLSRHPEVHDTHPLAHFLHHGAKHNLSPHPLIDMEYFGAYQK